jgi:hypothetical protein
VGFAGPSAVKTDALLRAYQHLLARRLATGCALAVGEKVTAGHARSGTRQGMTTPSPGRQRDGEHAPDARPVAERNSTPLVRPSVPQSRGCGVG